MPVTEYEPVINPEGEPYRSPTERRDDTLQAAHYKMAHQTNGYTKVMGLVTLGCACGYPVIVRAIQPYGVRTQNFQFTKDRSNPIYPTPHPDNEVSVNVGKSFDVPMPKMIPGPEPKFAYTIGGRYTYVEPVATDETTGFPGPRLPFLIPYQKLDSLARWEDHDGGDPSTLDTLIELKNPSFTWPFTHISSQPADQTLSNGFVGLNEDGQKIYAVDDYGRG